jgi:hypothetical protein
VQAAVSGRHRLADVGVAARRVRLHLSEQHRPITAHQLDVCLSHRVERVVAAELAGGERVVYAFKGLEYTRWTVGTSFPVAEDPGFPRRIADNWKDGLVLAPRAGVYVDWPNRSTAHSNRKIYFFMGDLYLRWDVPSNTRNYRLDILAGWKGWPAFA